MMRRGLLTGLLVVGGFLTSTSSATADTVLGQTGSGGDCSTAYPYTEIQLSTGGPPNYTVPAPGVITYWSHQGGPSESGQLRLKIYRPTANPNVFTVVGISAPMTLAANALTGAATDLPVEAGDVLGYTRDAGSHMVCLLATTSSQDVVTDAAAADTPMGMPTTFSGPGPMLRINISAVWSPPAATPTPTGQRAAALKKCRKKRSARARKRCRKKARLLPV